MLHSQMNCSWRWITRTAAYPWRTPRSGCKGSWRRLDAGRFSIPASLSRLSWVSAAIRFWPNTDCGCLISARAPSAHLIGRLPGLFTRAGREAAPRGKAQNYRLEKAVTADAMKGTPSGGQDMEVGAEIGLERRRRVYRERFDCSHLSRPEGARWSALMQWFASVWFGRVSRKGPRRNSNPSTIGE